MRVIVTKRKSYGLALDKQGVPVEEYFAGVTLPETIKGAKVYGTVDGPVVAMTGATLTAPAITGTPVAMSDEKPPRRPRGGIVKENYGRPAAGQNLVRRQPAEARCCCRYRAAE